MTRQLTAIITAIGVDGGLDRRAVCPAPHGLAAGSVSAASSSSRTTTTREGNTTTTQGQRASGSRTVTQTGDGYNVNQQVPDPERRLEDASARKSTSRIARSTRRSTTTNQWGQSATREREVEGQGGYATVEGSTKTSSGREASS